MEYPLIPMSEIREEPRKIAVAWHEAATNWIGDKAKLASDIQNYADNYAKEQNEALYQNSLSMGETNQVLVSRLAKYEEALEQIVNNNHKGTVALDIATEALNIKN